MKIIQIVAIIFALLFIINRIYYYAYGRKENALATVKQIEHQYLILYSVSKNGEHVTLENSKMPKQLIDQYIKLTTKYKIDKRY